jgi:hypothetical protein
MNEFCRDCPYFVGIPKKSVIRVDGTNYSVECSPDSAKLDRNEGSAIDREIGQNPELIRVESTCLRADGKFTIIRQSRM